MKREISKAVSFTLSGKMAHFRKFYSNSSSLTYRIPPRTVIAGLLASILELKRDSYYESLGSDNLSISVAVRKGARIKTQVQSINYLHNRYHSLLSGRGGAKNMHSQCKLELLMDSVGGKIGYRIWLAAMTDDGMKFLEEIIDRLSAENYGFGIYLGQRAFKADIENLTIYEKGNISFLEKSRCIDSIILADKAEIAPLESVKLHIVVDQMPVSMRQEYRMVKKVMVPDGRVLNSVKRVLYERNGESIPGLFKNCYRIGENTISFFEG